MDDAIRQNLDRPMLYLSKSWENLSLKAYHEPDTLQHWSEPAIDEISLVWMARGTMLMETLASQRQVLIQEGDWFLKPAKAESLAVRWHNLSPTAMQTLHIHLKQESFLSLAAETRQSSNSPQLVRKTGFQDNFLAQLAMGLRFELENPSALSSLYVETASQMLSLHLLRHYASLEFLPIQQGLSAQQIKQVSEYVQDSLTEALSLETMAQIVQLSPYHFARLFRQATGKSPYQFVLAQRIERAKTLLRSSKLSLAEIALECGFAHQSHFNQVFKRHLGISPRAYRISQ